MRKLLSAVGAAALLVVVFAGCIGGEKAPEMDPLEGQLVDGYVLNGTRGGIVGRLVNDIGVPVATAHLTIKGTDFSTYSNRTGSFQLLNITPGSHTLRVDHPDYKSDERPVSIEPAKVLQISLTMLPLVDVGAGYRPHLHDYWGGQAEKLVIDASFEWQEPYQCNGVYREAFCRYYDTSTQLVAAPCIFSGHPYFNNRQIWFNDPTQTVWPGTGRIDVSATWTDADYQGTKIAMAWRTPTSAGYEQGEYFNKGATYSIDVAGNQSDSGHQKYTLWEFWLCLADSGTQSIPQAPFLGRIQINMKIVRTYDVVAEPPHPDFWANGTSRVVIDPAQKGMERKFAPTYYSLARSSFGSGDDFAVRPLADHIVPPGTKELQVKLTWTNTGAASNPPWSFTYRSADVNPLSTKDPGQLTKPTPVESGTGSRTYVVAVKPEQTDAFYQRITSWLFYLNYEGKESDWYLVNQCGCDVSVKLTITAVQDPAFDAARAT